jgi:hypothetical protein
VPIMRIDTNQGVYGLGEVRDVANYRSPPSMTGKHTQERSNPCFTRLPVSRLSVAAALLLERAT